MRLWDLETGTERLRLETVGVTRALAFNDGGSLLASGDRDGGVRLWDLAGAAGVGPRVLADKCGGRVASLFFIDDGATLIGATRGGDVRLWDVASGAEQASPGGGGSPMAAVAIDPAGGLVTIGDEDGSVRVWRLDGGAQVAALDVHGEHPYALAFDATGARLACGTDEGGVWLWDLAADEGGPGLPTRLRTRGDRIMSLAFDPAGRLLASGARDGVRLWDLSGVGAPRPLAHLATDVGTVYALAFDAIGKRLATGSEPTGMRGASNAGPDLLHEFGQQQLRRQGRRDRRDQPGILPGQLVHDDAGRRRDMEMPGLRQRPGSTADARGRPLIGPVSARRASLGSESRSSTLGVATGRS